MNKRLVSILLAAVLLLSCAGTAGAEDKEILTVTFLDCWHGTVGDWTEEKMKNNACADFIKEKFGIQMIKSECPPGSETDYLNLVIASGTMPDMVNGPYWGDYAGGSGAVAIEAAKQGLIKDLAPYLPDYENLNAMYGKNLSAAVRKNLVYNEAYNGALYFLPVNVNFNGPEYETIHGDTLYARADVLKAVGVNAEDVTTPEELYDLLVKIRNAGLKDFSGNNDLIPLSTGHDGWREDNIYGWFRGNNISSFRQMEDGTVKYLLFTDYPEQRVNFMRRLLSEGLMDVECLTQTGEMVDSKVVQGMWGVVAVSCGAVNGYFYSKDKQNKREGTEWIPLGLKNLDGNPTVDVYQPGWTGGDLTWFNADIEEEKLRALLALADWFCTEEGYLFDQYGIEGVTFEYVDGLPYILPELQEKSKAGEINIGREYGVKQWTALRIPKMSESLWPIPDEKREESEVARRKMENQYFRPRVEVDKLSVDDLLKQWDGYDDFVEAISTIDAETYLKRAYYYTSDEEVTQLIEDLRNRFLEANVEDACRFIQENRTDEYAF